MQPQRHPVGVIRRTDIPVASLRHASDIPAACVAECIVATGTKVGMIGDSRSNLVSQSWKLLVRIYSMVIKIKAGSR